ncbi:glycosyltransferase [uncultured Treponema sp.]|nr:glycosyltransferase [uncultured Treponema sp.]
MSVFSLRHHTPDAQIFILTDNKTSSSFSSSNKRLGLINQGVNIITVNFDDSVSNTQRSRILKTTIPEHISGDFLFIDCDTIICDDLSSVENNLQDSKISAVLDGHVPLSEHKHKDYFIKREKKLGFSASEKTGKHYNSGVMLFKDCPESREFFKKWNELWTWCFTEKHDHHDQPAFNEASLECGAIIKELDGIWNCQLSQGGLAYLENAKIIHYFSSEGGKNYIPYYKLAEKNIQQKVKETGDIPSDVSKMILNPKFQFNKVHLINDQRIVSIMQSPLIFTIADIKSKLPWLFNVLESICRASRNFAKKLKKKK